MPTEGISQLQGVDVDYARRLGYGVKLLAVAERMAETGDPLPLSLRVQPTLVSTDHPLAGVNGVNNAILVEGDPIGRVMFYGPGAGAGPTASAVVADILNIAGIRQASEAPGHIDPLLAAGTWLLIASYYGWPVSTTHSIVGAILGFGIVYAGIQAIHWGKVSGIVASWVVSPVLSGTISYFIFNIISSYR